MSIFDEIGVRAFINAGGWNYTRYGGSIMPVPVVAAMGEASKHFVNIFELQDRMGAAIAELTKNEAAYVSCGAASAILPAVATCMAGTDAALAERLPDSAGMRNHVIMRQYDAGTESDPAIRAAVGKIVFVGQKERRATAAEVLGAIGDQTAAIVVVAYESEDEPEMREIVRGRASGRSRSCLTGRMRFRRGRICGGLRATWGVDAFVTSGGKAMRGPQSTGLVLGRKWIVDGCKFHGSPNLRIGRGMKVGKEEFAGIFAALKLFLSADVEAQEAEERRRIGAIAGRIEGVAGIKIRTRGSELEIELDQGMRGATAEEIAAMLLRAEPAILLRGKAGRITVRARLLQEGEERIVGERLFQVLSERGGAGARE
jgi:D-glucosaminate-6-phosphate ammonia-lyase